MSPQENANTAESVLRGEGDCLAPEQLELLLGEGVDSAIRQRYESHIQGCATCATELDLLRSFLTVNPEPDEEKDLAWVVSRLKNPAVDEVKPAKAGWWHAWGSVSPFSKVAVSLATLLLIVAGAIQLRQFRASGEKVEDAGGASVMRSTQISLGGPLGDVTSRPAKLSWSPADHAVRYEAIVEEVDGTELWKGESPTAELALPAGVQSQIVSKKTLVWRVTAFNAEGEKIAESQKGRFRLTE